MPIPIRYAPSSVTREQYDKVNEILRENGPEGPLHRSSFTLGSVRSRPFA